MVRVVSIETAIWVVVPIAMRMIVAPVSVVTIWMVVPIVTMVVTMMIIAVPSCGWNRATGYDCANNA